MQPRLVQQGTATQLRVELPQLRAGRPPVRLEVEGEGVTVLSSTLEGIGGFSGAETLWSVRVRVSRAVPPGDVLLVLRAFFADGKSVDVDGTITVVPPAERAAPDAGSSVPWVWFAVGVTLALALAAAALLLARRRRSAC
ncbi:MAG TPA: hypothetical protein VM049_12475 [Gaiellaceae bacterium]|nr:hypothetical protein [Gaiellaceae bacterium]